MLFNEVYGEMVGGKKIRRTNWKGYWAWENQTIMIHCWDGTVLDIRKTDNVEGTFENIVADDWIVIQEDKKEENNKTLFNKEIKINVKTVDDLMASFIKIYMTNGHVALWAVDSLEYEFYQRIDEAEEKDDQIDFLRALRLLHGEKQSSF